MVKLDILTYFSIYLLTGRIYSLAGRMQSSFEVKQRIQAHGVTSIAVETTAGKNCSIKMNTKIIL